jgi:hypothetical protein
LTVAFNWAWAGAVADRSMPRGRATSRTKSIRENMTDLQGIDISGNKIRSGVHHWKVKLESEKDHNILRNGGCSGIA